MESIFAAVKSYNILKAKNQSSYDGQQGMIAKILISPYFHVEYSFLSLLSVTHLNPIS
jgi:hypothetical protein